jgi:hypothetical protein
MRGISTRKTSIGWHVIRLHYSADEAKDPLTPAGAKWLTEARTGMSDARFRKEFEIDYGALGGQLVFPEWDVSIHVVKEFELHPAEWTVYMACDPHPRTPHAFVWLAINREGELVVPFSYWPEHGPGNDARFTVKDYVEHVKTVHEFFGWEARYKLMDVAGRSMNADEERSYFDAYRDAGLFFYPAKKNRDMSGFELINEALKPKPYAAGSEELMRPRLTVMTGNDELVYQISHLRFAEWRGNVVDKNDPQMPIEKRRHLVDALCYILLDQPRFVDVRRKPNTAYDPIYPNLGR